LFRGREVTFDENGLLAVFDGPARAIRCAMAINDSAQRLNISLKIGLHTGECDVTESKYSGLAVEFSKRIAEASNFGDILVSRTVKDLVAGSGLEFQESKKKIIIGNSGKLEIIHDKRGWKVSIIAGHNL
jgi:class 3 adenylate cyclase